MTSPHDPHDERYIPPSHPPVTNREDPREIRFRRRRRIALLTTVALASLAAYGTFRAAKKYLLAEGDIGAVIAGEDREPPDFQSIDKKHWQAKSSSPSVATAVTDAREKTTGRCAPGMVAVRGKMITDPYGKQSEEVESLQDATCVDWISKEFPARCAKFDKDKWAATTAKLPRKELAFCIDRYEYPNVEGENPMIVVSWNEAKAVCKKNGKRLCTEAEWTFACEGEEGLPYPYGYERDGEACVLDRPWHPFKPDALAPRDGERAREELERLWEADPSGSHAKCKSPFGVYDLTGNVDEWTTSVQTAPKYKSVLKGGYWGPVRARCRPATRAHDENFVAYQQSFRCCSDEPVGGAEVIASAEAPVGREPTTAGPEPADSAVAPSLVAPAAVGAPAHEDDEEAAIARNPRTPKLPAACKNEMAPSDAAPFAPFVFLAAAALVGRLRRRK